MSIPDLPTRRSPLVSVVMSVFNGSQKLGETIESILTQTMADFEFLIVNDGSSDASLSVLNHYQNLDSRIRVIDQSNQGLTRALNVGCAHAKADLIARQDVGDRSLPRRLERQAKYLDEHPEVVAVGVGAQRSGPVGEFLGTYQRWLSPQEVTNELLISGTGLVHPASMFRRSAFEHVGGYRKQFRFAQDTDLWLRLAEVGLLAECPEVLFELAVETDGISAQRIDQQVRLWQLARECHSARSAGLSEAELLTQAEQVSSSSPPQLSDSDRCRQQCRAEYFIGSQLFGLRDRRCRSYFVKVLRSPSLMLPATGKLLASWLTCK